MTMSSTLSNALSGLTAVSRSANLVSTNISNALTDGYGRREIELGARATGSGGGVSVIAITRIVDQAVLTDRRGADGDFARAEAQVGFFDNLQQVLGEPGSGLALSDKFADLEATLVTAAARPESEVNLTLAVEALDAVAQHLRQASDTVQLERGRADREIATAVTQLNNDLKRIEELNIDILRQSVTGETSSALMDERQRLIDQVSELIPVREVQRENGVVALLSENGLLMDGPAPVLEFTPVNVMAPGLSYSGGTLSGITINGTPVDMARSRHVLSGGKLQGLFEVRDALAPKAQEQLDALARDLVERFETTGVDPTLAPGDPGLLTDSGLKFAPIDELGLSGRLQVNALVDPSAGGAVWRLRDGLGALTEGDPGNAAGLHLLSDALTAPRVPVSGGFMSGARTAAGLAGDVLSSVGGARVLAEQHAAHASARATAMDMRLKEDGVDSDHEMQKLLLIEQAYAANARVISAVEAMIDDLMRI